jgi:hypothetical protein
MWIKEKVNLDHPRLLTSYPSRMNWASRQLALKLECSMLGAAAVARRVLPLQWVSSPSMWCRRPGCDRVAGGTSRRRSCAAVQVATELPEGRATRGAVPPSGPRPSCRSRCVAGRPRRPLRFAARVVEEQPLIPILFLLWLTDWLDGAATGDRGLFARRRSRPVSLVGS